MEIKRIEDYYDRIKEKFPELTEKQISKILTFGFRSFYTCNLYGGDVLSKSPYLTVYCGQTFIDPYKFTKYRTMKLRVKLRVKYKKKNPIWNGYYYFGLTDEDFEYYKSQMNSTGRRRHKFHFKKLKFYKVLEEVLTSTVCNHVFRMPFPLDVGFAFWKEDVETHNFEYIYRRNKDGKMEPVSYE